jgi:hypothetical protein
MVGPSPEASPKSYVQEFAGDLLDPDKFKKPVEFDEIMRAAEPTEAQIENLKTQMTAMDRDMSRPRSVMQARRDALDLRVGKYDWKATEAELAAGDYSRMVRLIAGIYRERQGGGRRPQGVSESETFLQQMLVQRELGVELPPGMSQTELMQVSDEYADRTRRNEQQKVEKDRHGRFLRLRVAIGQAGRSAQAAMTRLFQYLGSDQYYTDRETANYKVEESLGKLLQVQQGSSLEHAPDQTNSAEQNNELLLSLKDISFPVLIERGVWVDNANGGREWRHTGFLDNEVKLLNTFDVLDIFDENPQFVRVVLAGHTNSTVHLKANYRPRRGDRIIESFGVRDVYMSHDPDVKQEEGEALFGDLITARLLGVDLEHYKRHSDQYRFWTMMFPEGKRYGRELIIDDKDVYDANGNLIKENGRLVAWNPFDDNEYEYVRGEWVMKAMYPHYERERDRIQNPEHLGKAYKWLMVQFELFARSLGFADVWDKAVMGFFWPYPVRPAIANETYRGIMYWQGISAGRPYERTYYGSYMMENKRFLVPALRMMQSERLRQLAIEQDLMGKDLRELRWMLGYDRGLGEKKYKLLEEYVRESVKGDDELRGRIVREIRVAGGRPPNQKEMVEYQLKKELRDQLSDLRRRKIEFMMSDNSLRPWLEVYLDQMAKGEVAIIGEDVPLNGCGRVVEFGSRRIYNVALDVPQANAVRIDFGDYGQALEFQEYNCTQKGELRPYNSMLDVARGFIDHAHDDYMGTSLARIFYGWSPKAILDDMGETGRLEDIERQILRGEARPPYYEQAEWDRLNDAQRQEVAGLYGLYIIARHHSYKGFHWNNTAVYGPWQWLNYLKGARQAADARHAGLEAINWSGKPIFQNWKMTKPFGSHDEVGELVKTVQAETKLRPFSDGNLRAEAVEDYLVALFDVGVAHKKTDQVTVPRRRHKVSPEPRRNTMNMNPYNPTERADIWKNIPVDISYAKPELGIYPYKVKASSSDGFRAVLLGPGGRPIFEAEQEWEEESPATRQYGGRNFDWALVGLVLEEAADQQGMTYDSMLETLLFLANAHRGRILKNPDMTKMEMWLLRAQAAFGGK